MVGRVTITEGEFAGWETYEVTNTTFDSTVGPFYRKMDPDGSMRCAFRAEQKHMNFGGRMHGGCLMTFADFALFALGHEAMEGGYGVTVAFTAEFIDGAVEGELLTARGDTLRKGGSLSFVRGIIYGEDGRPVLNFSGTIKKRRKQA